MRLHLLRQAPTRDQLQEMLEAQGSYIKLAVDVAHGIVVGGGKYHADCEEVLLEQGSRQEDIWGADWYPDRRTVTFGALINNPASTGQPVDGSSGSGNAGAHRARRAGCV